MSKLSQILLYNLNKVLPKPHQTLLKAKETPLDYLQFLQTRAASSFETFGKIDLSGKTVLDVGCGLGANLVFLITQGAHRVVALDIDAQQIQRTHSMIQEHYRTCASKIQFAASDASQMPFTDELFDVIVCADTLEHVEDLKGTLQECARVLRPGGFLYAYFPPFYAPWGAHMVNWIRLPWCQILFSEETILQVARRLDDEGRSINAHLPPATQLDLGAGKRIPFVSHLTIQQFQRTIGQIPEWRSARLRLLPPNWRKGGLFSNLMQPLNKIPLLREAFTAKAVCTLEKR